MAMKNPLSKIRRNIVLQILAACGCGYSFSNRLFYLTYDSSDFFDDPLTSFLYYYLDILVGAVILAALIAYLVSKAITGILLIRYYRHALPLIAADRMGLISDLAAGLSLPVPRLQKYLRKMIDSELLSNAYLVQDRLIFSEITEAVSGEIPAGFVHVTCPGCAALNVIPLDEHSCCKSCGRPLS
jgi:hypothetical protein